VRHLHKIVVDWVSAYQHDTVPAGV
jgi:hypothetical protein